MEYPGPRYLPFLTGVYSTAPGLVSLNKGPEDIDKKVFQINKDYQSYLKNKRECRAENIHKYFCQYDFRPFTKKVVNNLILSEMLKDYPEIFEFKKDHSTTSLYNRKQEELVVWDHEHQIKSGIYESLFDALACQLQEDIAVIQMIEGGTEYLSAIHLCSPNHWAPGEKIGKPFDQIHRPVPEMEKVLSHHHKMLANVVNTKGPYTRFAWGISTDTRLNHHPLPPQGISSIMWNGRSIEEPDQSYYVRVERQNLIGLPEANAFIFTIRTYFYAVQSFNGQEKSMLKKALQSMTKETREYKGLSGNLNFLMESLDGY